MRPVTCFFLGVLLVGGVAAAPAKAADNREYFHLFPAASTSGAPPPSGTFAGPCSAQMSLQETAAEGRAGAGCDGSGATPETLPALAANAEAPGAQTAAQEPQSIRSPKPEKQPLFRSFLKEQFRMWTAPLRPGNYDTHSMSKYGLPFLIISGASIASDRKTSEWLPNTEGQRVWSDRVSQIGAPYTLAGIAGATYLMGSVGHDDHLKETGVIALRALAHTQLMVFALKEMTQRERPIEDKHRVGFWRGGDSFPSGHAASSFTVAAVFAYEYRDHIAVPITAYSLASLVSASRMSARRHWVSDIFVGGSLGFMVGRFMYKQHHDPSLPGSPVQHRSSLIPEIGVGARGAALLWTW